MVWLYGQPPLQEVRPGQGIHSIRPGFPKTESLIQPPCYGHLLQRIQHQSFIAEANGFSDDRVHPPPADAETALRFAHV